MGSRNPERDRPALLDSTRLDSLLETWVIWVACRNCPQEADLFRGQLLKLCGAEGTVGDLTSRLRCRACGSRKVQLVPRFVGLRRD